MTPARLWRALETACRYLLSLWIVATVTTSLVMLRNELWPQSARHDPLWQVFVGAIGGFVLGTLGGLLLKQYLPPRKKNDSHLN